MSQTAMQLVKALRIRIFEFHRFCSTSTFNKQPHPVLFKTRQPEKLQTKNQTLQNLNNKKGNASPSSSAQFRSSDKYKATFYTQYDKKMERKKFLIEKNEKIIPMSSIAPNMFPIKRNAYLSFLPIEEKEQESSIEFDKIDFSTVLSKGRQTKFLFEAMRYELYLVSRQFLKQPQIEWHSRMVVAAVEMLRNARMADVNGEHKETDIELAQLIKSHFTKTPIPELIRSEFEIQLDLISEPSTFFSKFTSRDFQEEFKRLQADVQNLILCVALEQNNWNGFSRLSTDLKPHVCQHLFDRLLKFAREANENQKKAIAKWYVERMCELRKPIPVENFEDAKKLIEACGLKLVELKLGTDGQFRSESIGPAFKVPPSKPLTDTQFNNVKTAFLDWMEKESKNEAYLLRDEFLKLSRMLYYWRKTAEQHGFSLDRCVIVDAQNVLVGTKPVLEIFKPFTRLVEGLIKEYGAAVLVGRHFLKHVFTDAFYTNNPRVRTFYCDKRTEDDLMAILAAVSIGPQARIITNDRMRNYYKIHKRDNEESDVFSLEDYWNKIVIRHSKYDNMHLEDVPNFDRIVQTLDSKNILFTIYTEKEFIPDYDYYLLKL